MVVAVVDGGVEAVMLNAGVVRVGCMGFEGGVLICDVVVAKVVCGGAVVVDITFAMLGVVVAVVGDTFSLFGVVVAVISVVSSVVISLMNAVVSILGCEGEYSQPP